MHVAIDQPRHDIAAASVDHDVAGGCFVCGRVDDHAVLDDDRRLGVGHGRGVENSAVADDGAG